MMFYFSDLSDITLNMYYINSSHHLNTLRSRGHGLTLSVIPSEFMRKNFINRMLFNDNIDC